VTCRPFRRHDADGADASGSYTASMFERQWVVAGALAVIACSSSGCSSSGSVTAQDDAGTGADGSHQGGDGGTTPSGAGLIGTWDLLATESNAAPQSGTLQLSPTKMIVSITGNVLAYETDGANAMTLTWTTPRESHAITTQRTAAPLDLGIVPLSLGGDWSFSEQGSTNTCSGSAHDGTIGAECVGSFGNLPVPSIAGKLTATRTSALASSFGALGGVWSINTASGTQCEARFSGNELTNTCSNGALRGGLTLTFAAGVASGTTSGGIELSARRR
jgi:hypothetical protein